MRKIAARCIAGLAVAMLATPVLACEGMKGGTAWDKSDTKPAVASTGKSEGAKQAPKSEAAKPASAAN